MDVETDSDIDSTDDTPVTTPGPYASVVSDSVRENSAALFDNIEIPLKRRRGRPSYYQSLLSEEEAEEAPKTVRKRGRPAKKNKLPTLGYVAQPKEKRDIETGYDIVDDELLIEKEDPDGSKKIMSNGNLLGGREYKCRTTTIFGRGSRLYMFSTEVARSVGYRDSYLMFSKHKKLYKIMLSDEEKWDLIDRDVVPQFCKDKPISILTARSVFREFGSLCIIGGKKIIDDYWEEDALVSGVIHGELADPEDNSDINSYDKNQFIAWHSADSETLYPLKSLEKLDKQTIPQDETWLYNIARSSSEFNKELTQERLSKWDFGYYEPHTNLIFFPNSTQPRNVVWKQHDSIHKTPKFDTIMHIKPDEGIDVHLLNVPDHFLSDLDQGTLQAIRSRQAKEKLAKAHPISL